MSGATLPIIIIGILLVLALIGDSLMKFLNNKADAHRVRTVERERTDNYIARRQYDAILAHTETQKELAQQGRQQNIENEERRIIQIN